MINSNRAIAKVMNEHGIAAWNMQYRGASSLGSGWPGTWLDIANGFDALPVLAGEEFNMRLLDKQTEQT